MHSMRDKLLLLVLRFFIRRAIYIADKSENAYYVWTSFEDKNDFKNYLYLIVNKIDNQKLLINDKNNLLIVFLPTGDWDSISDNGTLANIICWLLRNIR